MSYSRPCGVHTADCAASACRCVSVDVGPVNGPQEPVCDFGDDFPCCTHDNPLHTALDGAGESE